MDTGRLEAFSDGVFAVAITLLVLDLGVPAGGPVVQHLAEQWPSFAAFVVSFVLIGVIWVNHHGLMSRLARADRALLFINLGLLMSVVVLPFTTALFSRFLTGGGTDAHVVGAIFSGALLLMGIAFSALYRWAARHPELLKPDAPIDTSLRSWLRFSAGSFFYALGIPLAFLDAFWVLIISGVLAAYYVVDQVAVQRG